MVPFGCWLGSRLRALVVLTTCTWGVTQSPPTDWIRERLPAGSGDHALAYDSARQRVVMFGGRSNHGPHAATWERDGADWSQRLPVASPSARSGHAMAYDAARQRVVLFGGEEQNQVRSAETWEWDGADWRLLAPATSPSGRSGHAMAYDEVAQRVVLFGGADSNSTFAADTWEWDGSNWTRRTPPTNPGARFAHAMAYDAARGRVVLFGGWGFANTVWSDTWEWDGSRWILATPSASPGPRFEHAMAYDCRAGRPRIVLFGGRHHSGWFDDTWEWDGGTWSQRTPVTTPSARFEHAMVCDVSRQRIVMFGGRVASLYSADTWEWDGSDWGQPTLGSVARCEHAMAYDAARQCTVLFGGTDAGGHGMSDTWEWSGATWSKRTPTATPGARASHAVAFDFVRQRVVLFGGTDAATGASLSDTWEWDGGNWARLTTAAGPSARSDHVMVSDASRRRVVLFGGFDGVALSDTWEWDGARWTRRASTASPSARSQHAMTYDVARQRCVLYGGLEGGTNALLSDTWEWDGSNWTQRAASVNPGARRRHAMAYDEVRRRTVLFGEAASPWGPLLDDTWEWDGNVWTRHTPGRRPAPRASHAMAYDSAHESVVLFGGDSGIPFAPLADTWRYGATAGASARSTGSGCAGSNGPPVLTSNLPYLGNPAFRLELLSARPASPCVFGLSAVGGAVPFGSCTLYLGSPIVAWAATTTPTGNASTPRLVIPLDGTLRGLTLYAQAFLVDPLGPVFGLAFSDARVLEISY